MKVLAAVVCVILAARITLLQGVTAGILISILLLPVWVVTLWRHRGGSAIVTLGGLAIVSGLVLTDFFAGDHPTSESMMQQNTFSLISVIGGIGVVVWVRSLLGNAATALWYGVGLMVGVVLHGLDMDNVWKFDLSVPATVIVLALCMMSRRPWVEMIALLLLAVVSALNDSRSAGSMLLVAAALVVWQSLGSRLAKSSTTVRTLAVFGFTAVIGYAALQAFILEGWFGKAAAVRSEAQIAQSGSLLLGGRPELGASTELIAANPLGLGSGTLANGIDLLIAKTGMARLNYDPNNGYVEKYMFGNGFEVHSMLGDLWIRFGLFGAAMLVVALVIITLGTAGQVAKRAASGLMIYLAIQVFWDSLFAPFFSTSISTLVLGVALAMVPRTRKDTSAISDPEFVSFAR
ncbi:hypothetical protein SRABI76_02575 [Microbacterium oxydans]|uniref:Uncharacterized protein n=1 Tax=Microbacterium oxydans TaxID=82380 RepID=A0A0F0L8K2_9MICO|nr:hypothetical protein [Microbacterium oxydans]KJL29527.1 hypothetical protein RS83_01544 [Microbacterium oxydans]CAH0223621.1 hypothetical protein SRABI76_02575 [Microbacterium oxydans]